MIRTLLIRGMIVGVAGGLLAFAFAYVFGGPQVDQAIAFEAAHDHATHSHHGPEVFSREVQSTVGLLTATTSVGLTLGGLVALIFAGLYGRVGSLSARTTALAIAAAGFTAFVLVPLTKYPANPPSVGDAGTIGARTELYFGLILIALLAIGAGVRVARGRAESWGRWNAGIAGAATFLGLIAVAEVLLPGVDEVPSSFSATVLWQFRLASAGTQLMLWSTIGVGFGWAAERTLQGRPLLQRSRNQTTPANHGWSSQPTGG